VDFDLNLSLAAADVMPLEQFSSEDILDIILPTYFTLIQQSQMVCFQI
jgi:hypothetical protein